MKSFRELRVWQAAMNLVEKHLPSHPEISQTRDLWAGKPNAESCRFDTVQHREGHTREHIKEYLHHLSMAQASLAELETQLEISGRLKYLLSDELKELLSEVSSLGRQMYALRNSLTTK